MLSLQSKFLRLTVQRGVQGLATKGGGRKKQRRNLGKQNTEKLRNVLGMQVEQLKAVKYELKQEYAADPEIVRKLSGDEEAQRVFGVEMGDRHDSFNLELSNLYQKLLEYQCEDRLQKKLKEEGYRDAGIPASKDQNIKKVAVNHIKMKYIAAKLPVDPSKLRGPQIKYHPHMEVRVMDRQIKNRKGREEVIWNKGNYVRLKQAEYAAALGNRYDSYYVFSKEVAQSKRLLYSRNNFFFRWVYYHAETEQPYELHGKEAAQMHRWEEYRDERNTALREIELQDIQKYAHVIKVLGIPPVYVPTFKLPKPKWFRNNTISNLSESDIARLRAKRKHGAVSTQEEEDATIPNRPTKFNELIVGWHNTDQNVVVGSDFHYGTPKTVRDPVPLAGPNKSSNETIQES